MLEKIIEKLKSSKELQKLFKPANRLNYLNKLAKIINTSPLKNLVATNLLLIVLQDKANHQALNLLTDSEKKFLIFESDLNFNLPSPNGSTILMLIAEHKGLDFSNSEILHIMKKSNLYRRTNTYFNRLNVLELSLTGFLDKLNEENLQYLLENSDLNHNQETIDFIKSLSIAYFHKQAINKKTIKTVFDYLLNKRKLIIDENFFSFQLDYPYYPQYQQKILALLDEIKIEKSINKNYNLKNHKI